MKVEEKRKKRKRKIKRIRWKIYGTADEPRLCVSRSLKHMYAQIINDMMGETLVAANSLQFDTEGQTKTEVAHEVGKKIGKKALEKGIEKVVFDRHGYPFHGRVKAVAEGAREAGLEF